MNLGFALRHSTHSLSIPLRYARLPTQIREVVDGSVLATQVRARRPGDGAALGDGQVQASPQPPEAGAGAAAARDLGQPERLHAAQDARVQEEPRRI